MASFAFYLDSSLTQMVTSNVEVPEGTNDMRFYLGSTNASVKLQNATAPGVDSIVIAVEDTNPGSNAEASWIKLAFTQAGLSGASGGASLSVGTTVYGGVSSAVPIWVRIANSLSGAASSTDLSLHITDAKEFAA
jgi:hypothetical protein